MEVKQLILAKYLFRQGETVLNKRNPMSCGLAISLFQDAAEIFIWTTAKEIEADVKDHIPFTKLWECVKNAKLNTEKKELPLKGKMLDLNRARVGFKHNGILPDASESSKFLLYTDEFLRTGMQVFFSIDFDDLSLADLIENDEIKKIIKKAEQDLAESKLDDCMFECAKAERLISKPFHYILPKLDYSFTHLPELFDEPYKQRVAGGWLSYLERYLNRLAELSIAAITDISLTDYFKFRELIPYAEKMGDGSWKTMPRRTSTYSKTNASFCIKYVLDYALIMHEQLGY